MPLLALGILGASNGGLYADTMPSPTRGQEHLFASDPNPDNSTNCYWCNTSQQTHYPN